ncbi:hypothetical protein Tco_1130236 [Tanacetum coccineum]
MGHVVVIMFDKTAYELVKCLADSIVQAKEESFNDVMSLPPALTNVIGSTHTLELKSHTCYEHETVESFTCWNMHSAKTTEESAVLLFMDGSTVLMVDSITFGQEMINILVSREAYDKVFNHLDMLHAPLVGKVLILTTAKHPSVSTPLKPSEEKKSRREDLEDSDAELSPSPAEGMQDGEAGYHSDRKKKKRVGSWNNPTENPSLANILHKSAFIHSNTIINWDGKVQSLCGLKLADIVTPCPATTPVPGNTGVALTQKTVASTSKQPFGRSKMRKASNRASEGVPISYHNLGPTSYQCSNGHANMWYEERTNKARKAINPTFSNCCQDGKVRLSIFHGPPPPLNKLLDYTDPAPSRYAQLYFFDTENEVRNQMSAFIDKETAEGVDPSIVQRLIEMLNQSSSVAKETKSAMITYLEAT